MFPPVKSDFFKKNSWEFDGYPTPFETKIIVHARLLRFISSFLGSFGIIDT